jgi:gas vesicle protein
MKPLIKTIAALGTGIAIGAAAGVLLAPNKGTETRRIIRKKGQKIADRLQRKVKESEQLVTGVKEDLKDTLNGINKKINQFT